MSYIARDDGSVGVFCECRQPTSTERFHSCPLVFCPNPRHCSIKASPANAIAAISVILPIVSHIISALEIEPSYLAAIHLTIRAGGLTCKLNSHSLHRLPSPPTLRERRHSSLTRGFVAVRRRAVLMVTEGERPHPGRSYWCGCRVEDAPDDHAIGKHVVIVVLPHTGLIGRLMRA